jgi:hypothetical protein
LNELLLEPYRNEFSIQFFKELYLRYIIQENKKSFLIVQNIRSPVWIDGKKHRMFRDDQDKFYLHKKDLINIIEDEISYRNRLQVSVASGNSNLTEDQVNELLDQ